VADKKCFITHTLRAKAATAIARLSHHNSVRRLSVCLSFCHTVGSVKNGAS